MIEQDEGGWHFQAVKLQREKNRDVRKGEEEGANEKEVVQVMPLLEALRTVDAREGKSRKLFC